ncbi:MAG: ethanolamine ammonia lyase-activating protein [Chloroflexi bacterium]|nr:ethanolamine ammonia lyase-activating protein [Chloroflexota bacterium]
MTGPSASHDPRKKYRSAYQRWVQTEGIPVVEGYAVEDLNNLPLAPWGRKGGKGAFINLVGNEGVNDTYVCEIAPGGSLKPQKHLYEETILILNGRGATTLWQQGGPAQTFEWQEWSLFAIPINTWHQHFNGQGDRPVRYVASTSAPLIMNLFHNTNFIFGDSFIFDDRFSGEQDYFTRPGKFFSVEDRIWETNFVPDTRKVKLYRWNERGAGGDNIHFELSDNTMTAHISEFPVGTYKKAHRHGPGGNVIILNGEGYSLMWLEGQPKVKVGWRPGSMFVPPDKWFHQHFNTGAEPARYLALRWGSKKNILDVIGKIGRPDEDIKKGGDQIEYRDQDPEIEAIYAAELSRKGLRSKMGQFL